MLTGTSPLLPCLSRQVEVASGRGSEDFQLAARVHAMEGDDGAAIASGRTSRLEHGRHFTASYSTILEGFEPVSDFDLRVSAFTRCPPSSCASCAFIGMKSVPATTNGSWYLAQACTRRRWFERSCLESPNQILPRSSLSQNVCQSFVGVSKCVSDCQVLVSLSSTCPFVECLSVCQGLVRFSSACPFVKCLSVCQVVVCLSSARPFVNCLSVCQVFVCLSIVCQCVKYLSVCRVFVCLSSVCQVFVSFSSVNQFLNCL